MATIRAKVRNGKLIPLKKLPKSWKDGDEVELHGERIVTDPAEIDAHFAKLDRLAKKLDDPEEWRQIEETLAEHDREAKEWMRREMGLGK